MLRQMCCYYDFTDAYHLTTMTTGAIKLNGVAAATIEGKAEERSSKRNCCLEILCLLDGTNSICIHLH